MSVENYFMMLALAAVPAAGLAGAAASSMLAARKRRKRDAVRPAVIAPPGIRCQEETGVLCADHRKSSVFGDGFVRASAILIRRKTGERAYIEGPLFLIGKEKGRTDFCITDNAAVSRIHAGIVCRDNTYYLVDRNSTNGTYLNGRRVSAGEEVLLEPGDRIRLADEELDFWL